MLPLGTRLAGLVILALLAAACSGNDDEGEGEPSTHPDASRSASEEPPTLVERFYPDIPPERIKLGKVEYTDPCRLLTVAEARRLFEMRMNEDVLQEVVVRSAPSAEGVEASCSIYPEGYEVSITYTDSPESDLRYEAHPIGDKVWFWPDNDPGAFDDPIEELGYDTSATKAVYRFRFAHGLIEMTRNVPAGLPDDYFNQSALKATQLIRSRLADPSRLSQRHLGPVLREKPVARGTTILDACDLLSPEIVAGLTGNDEYNQVLEHTTNRWHHERGNNGIRKKWSSPVTTCDWGTGADLEESPHEYDVALLIRSHPDFQEAHRSYLAVLEKWGESDATLRRTPLVDIDAGGWSSSLSFSASSKLSFRVGRYSGELTVTTGDHAAIRSPGDMDEAAAAMMDRLREYDR